MALIDCPWCGARISDKALACPKCGKSKNPENGSEKNPLNVIKKTIPWARFFARLFDITLIAFLAGIFVAIVEPSFLDISNAGIEFIALFTLYPLYYLLIEPWMITSFGTTPGKALYGIRVRDSNNSNINFRDSVRRGKIIWLNGEWLCVPLLIAVGRIRSYNYYQRKGITYWDEKLNIHYDIGNISSKRIVFINILICILITIFHIHGSEL